MMRNSQEHGVLHLERAGNGWRVNGNQRPDLDGAEEPDLSVTPFCNTFAIRRTPRSVGDSLTLDIAFIDGPALTVARSRQRYVRQGSENVRYVDLGLSSGFSDDPGGVHHLMRLIPGSDVTIDVNERSTQCHRTDECLVMGAGAPNIFSAAERPRFNFEVSCFWDAGFDVRLGDAVNGFLDLR
jgi:hypothetical protein